tara:strand:+ start:512 stop:727 length:216 start_codon:yes stop_codon:yes gene_type:complete
MRMDNYTKKEMNQDFKEIKEHILEENLDGAAITEIILDVYDHYEVANRCNLKFSKGHYRDLLTRLVKTYGH